MASIHFNPRVPGQLARVVLARRGDKVFFARPPIPREGPVPAALARQRQRFRDTAAYAKAVLGVPARRAAYEATAQAQKKSVFLVTMTDFLRKPVVRKLDLEGYHGRVGDPILVSIRADLNYQEVRVELRRPDGTRIEEGDASPHADGLRYLATKVVPIGTAIVLEVTVRDNDDIMTSRTVDLTVA